jgi:hypothetical protein
MTGVDYANNAGGKGWSRNIKYDKREYGELIRRVRGVMGRLGGDVKAVDVEKVGWVLGKEKAVIPNDGEVVKKVIKTAVKRKASEKTGVEGVSARGPRRSKRQRK